MAYNWSVNFIYKGLGLKQKMLYVLYFLVALFVIGLAARTYINKVYFFRDPVRAPESTTKGTIIAPCDGKVVYIKRVKDGRVVSEKLGEQIPVKEITKTDFGGKDGWLLGIYMTPLDVHFNYAPIEGTVKKMVKTQAKVNLPMVDLWEYIKVTYLRKAIDVFSSKYRLVNERLTIFLESKDASVAMVEIADKFVNKISAYIKEGDNLKLGQKTSFIERGSQVDLIIFSPDVEFLVKVGDQTYGGQTAVAKITR